MRIPIRIHPLFWLLCAFIGWMSSGSIFGVIIWTGIILVSVLIHEFGHALTAVYFGQNASIHLMVFGGLTERRGGKLEYWKEFITVLNGPLAGFLLCGIAYFLRMLTVEKTFSYEILTIVVYVNLFWTIVNLLPIHPLDGGKLLSIFLESLFGMRGVKIALFASILMSAAVAILFFSIRAIIAGALFFILTFENYRAWRESMTMSDADQDLNLQKLLKEAEQDMHHNQIEAATDKLKHIRLLSKSGVIYLMASEYLARIYNQEGKYQEAYEILNPINKKVSDQSLVLLHHLAYKTEKWQAAIDIGRRAYQHIPNYDTAVINALSYSILGESKAAIGWLQCALKEGLPNIREILTHKEFDRIRNDPSFKTFEKHYFHS